MRHLFTKDIRRAVIKVGTSILTKNGSFDKKIVNDLASEVSGLLKKGVHVYIVSSGAIGAGMSILKTKRRPTAIEGLQAAAAIGQRYLMQTYEEAFVKHGFSTAQVLLTWDDLSQKKRFHNAKHTLDQIQKWGLVPIINENDTVATDEIRFGDNDRLSSLLSILVEADVLVILSDTDGLYAHGNHGVAGDRIKIVERMEASIFSHVNDNKNSFTVGGMSSKLRAIQTGVSSGIPVFLACGRDKKVLSRLFAGEDIGTFFAPDQKRSGKKNWVRNLIMHLRSSAKNRRVKK